METATANGMAPAGPQQQRFVALAMPEPGPSSAPQVKPPDNDVRIEARRGDLQVTVRWPSSSASDCALWLRELLR